MKYTDRELEDILNKLIASTRSPRGRFSAASSYPQLEKKLNLEGKEQVLPLDKTAGKDYTNKVSQ